jgi:hypothetical protein
MASDLVLVGKWSIGYALDAPITGFTLLQCEFTHRKPLTLAFRPEDAVTIAKAILVQHENPPPRLS